VCGEREDLLGEVWSKNARPAGKNHGSGHDDLREKRHELGGVGRQEEAKRRLSRPQELQADGDGGADAVEPSEVGVQAGAFAQQFQDGGGLSCVGRRCGPALHSLGQQSVEIE